MYPPVSSCSAESFRDLTGVPELDRLLRLFERETVAEIDVVEGVAWELSARWGSHSDNAAGSPRVYHLAEPEIGAGMCYAVSQQLCDFLRGQGVVVRLSDQSPFELDDERRTWCTPDRFGYTDRPLAGYEFHHWAEIVDGERVYGVDFTSTQYGYQTWPVVQLLDQAGGRWLRDW